MAVQVKAGGLGKASVLSVVPAGYASDRQQRINFYMRRRRIARLKTVAETLIWCGASAGLLLVAIGGLMTLR